MSVTLERQEQRIRVGSWEQPAWVVLLAVAGWARLWDLGLRAMTHDESLHAYFSFQLFSQGTYHHDPIYHGPLLYHLDALVFFLIGATDFTSRLAPTLVGLALVGCLWLLRGYLGRRGAFLAAVLVTISPTLLFYSRHLRNDIYIAFFTVLWIYGAFRYIDQGQRRWLHLVTASMGLAFITKEVSFITGAVIGAFFAMVAMWPSSDDDAASRSARAADLSVLMLALVLPFASGAGFLALGWAPVGEPAVSAVAGRGALVILGLFGAASLAGSMRFGWRAWMPAMGAFWGLQVIFFTTFFTNVRGGLASGIVGSLGYWLTQHEVARAGQPWFYYAVIGALYEFLPILLGGAAAAVAMWRIRDRTWDPVEADDLPLSPAAPGRAARRLWMIFVVWWTVASWAGYALAGEKMPWLLVHQVLPLCLLAGWGARRLLGTGGEPDARRSKWLLAGGSACAAAIGFGLVRSSPFSGRDLQATADTAGWWIRVLALAGLFGLMSNALLQVGWREGRRAIALGLVVLGSVLTARASLQVNFVNFDMATEPLSFAQASPDVRRIMREIEAIDERAGGHRALRVAFDDESAWPLSWYLRGYPNAVSWGTNPALASSAPVILVGPKNRAVLRPHVARGYVRQRGILYWWPLQGYASLTPAKLWALLADANQRRDLWQIFMYRRYGIDETQWPSRREFDMYVRDDTAALVGLSRAGAATVAAPPPTVFKDVPWEADVVITGPFGGFPLSRPTSVAVSTDGAWLLADGGNHRVVVIEPDGRPRALLGNGRCAMSEPGQPGCLDPDGPGPRATGDGQFNEPWGVAAGSDGRIFVADTWNGRMQVFDANGAFQGKWGRFGSAGPADGEREDPRFYGPRALAFDAEGHLVVADTGNKRLVFFASTGEWQRSVGPGVDLPPPLDEPTGVAHDANGTLLVADMWNQRMLRLDRFARTIAAWPVPGWDSRDAEDKAAVATDASGRVYACDPEGGRILVFAPSGAIEASLRLPAAGAIDAKPTGVAIDAEAGRLLVVDRAGNRLLVMPIYRPAS